MTQILRLLTVLLLVPFAMQAQTPAQLPNASFEELDTFDYPKPAGWWDSHNAWAFNFGPFPYSTDRTFLESYDENFSWELETVEGGIFGSDLWTKYTPGILTNGTPFMIDSLKFIDEISVDSRFIKGGAAFTDTPSVFYGYYQYTPVAGDSAWVYIRFWDNAGTVVGESEWSTTDAASDWTQFRLDIDYTGEPDSMLLVISSSAHASLDHVGSVMYVDSVGFLYNEAVPNGIFNPGQADARVYPNPATDVLVMENPFDHPASLLIFSATGELMLRGEVQFERRDVRVKNWAPGTYFYQIITENQRAEGSFQVR